MSWSDLSQYLGTLLAWIGDHWGIVLAVVPVLALVVAFLRLRLQQRLARDVTIKIGFADQASPLAAEMSLEQVGWTPEPIEGRLVAANIGGSKSPKGRLVLTFPPQLKALPSDGWKPDRPNPLRGSSSAVSCRLPRMGRSERRDLPALTVVDTRGIDMSDGARWGGSNSIRYRLQWEAWARKRRMGSELLEIRFKIERPRARQTKPTL